ncbi:hypothetical protein QWJ90_07045 [Microbacterium oryzae]|uniref:hypothetical protein n=1 Tax=Microbacterium oryzae TaxID=743009 RepID=UPI0025AF1084|nr:hypothetical protein [Microbacterium oryzae]MDN3310681.1 hypothetical protein [Microbacterium oryzae]
MAAHVLRLRAALLLGALRAPDRRPARIAAATILAVVVVIVAVRGLALAALPDTTAAAVLVLAGSALTVAFALAPLLAAAADPLDPRRFRQLDAPPAPLAGVLLLAAAVSVPTWVLLAYEIVAAVIWAGMGAPTAAVVLGALLHALICVLLARVAMGLRSVLGGEAGVPGVGGAAIAALLVAAAPVVVLAAPAASPGGALERVADQLVLSPFAPGTGLAAAAERGDGTGVAVAVGVVMLAACAAAWFAVVRRLLTTVEHPVAARGGAGLGWFALLPRNAVGAVAARSLVYGLRDSRYLANLLVVPVGGVLPVVPLLVAGVPAEIAALVPVPLMALFYGWLPHNDLAYDASAVWLHIATGVRGVADRAGRLAPVTVVAVPVIAVATTICLLASGRPDALWPVLALALALLLSGYGLSSIASVVAPYAVARPGDGPFQQPQRTVATGTWSQALVLVGTVVLSAPTAWLAWRAISAQTSAMPAVLVGLATGVVVLLAGIRIGARVFDARGTRIMEFAAAS